MKLPPNRRNLTPLFVSKVKSQPKAANYWDLKERGLTLRVQPSGHRAFKYVYSFRGRPRWFHLGQIHLADARRLAARLRLAVIEGKDGERATVVPWGRLKLIPKTRVGFPAKVCWLCEAVAKTKPSAF